MMGQEGLDRRRDDDRGMVCGCRWSSWGQNLVERGDYMLFSCDHDTGYVRFFFFYVLCCTVHSVSTGGRKNTS